MKRPSLSKQTLGYIGILAAALLIAVISGRTSVASAIDDYAYDWMFRLRSPAPVAPRCMILAIDDPTFSAMGGVQGYRRMLATALELLTPAEPKVIAVDMVLADKENPAEDERLARAMQPARNLVLVAHLSNGQWETPLPGFRASAASLGHDEADENSTDGVTREIPLEERTASARYWSLALEAFRLARGEKILESPETLQIGTELIPAARTAKDNRPLRVLYTSQAIPQIPLKDLADKPELAAQFRGQIVFVGVTSISGSYDRVATPYGQGRIPGVEVHARLFETLERGRFLTDASTSSVLLFCLLVVTLFGLTFVLLNGSPAYIMAGALLLAAHLALLLFFSQGIVFPYFAPLASAWLAAVTAASYQHFVARRQLRKAETDRKRYQQAIHFVTHEMRTPLTAIQGSSELMGRYALPEEKRKQIADMINQESKRLARMIQTFLDVERLSDGQMELKH